MIRYFDGMGNEKTLYVQGLEEKVARLEKQILESGKQQSQWIQVNSPVEVEQPKENKKKNAMRKQK